MNVYRILTAAPQISWLTALIGIPCVASLAFLKARYPRFPRALAVIVAAELLVLGLYKAVPEISEDRLRGDGDGFWWPPRIPILGAVAGGVPVPRVPWATMPMPLWNSTADAFGPPTQISPASYTGPLLVPAMMIATIGFVSSMAVSQNYAKHFHDDPPRPNQVATCGHSFPTCITSPDNPRCLTVSRNYLLLVWRIAWARCAKALWCTGVWPEQP